MAEEKQKLLLELQMEELRAYYGVEKDASKSSRPSNARSENNAKIAKLYEDAAEYKEDLRIFEYELEIVKTSELKDILASLNQAFPDYEGNYEQELGAILVAQWTQFVELKNTHPNEQLEFIKQTTFLDIIEKFNTAFPEYNGNFEADVKDILVKRWESIIEVKKEHIQEELDEIEMSGLKPDYAEKVYNQYHGIE